MNSIWAIGRNYKDHAKEMNAPVPTRPLVFLKSFASINQSSPLDLPREIPGEIHHELELAVLLGEDLKPSKVALALDLTARDLQAEAKKKGEPWTLAKSFRNACPMSPWINYQDENWFQSLQFQLTVNGNTRQQGQSKDMIFSLSELLKFLKTNVPLLPGDIILTGTPQGVGPLMPGDEVQATMGDYIRWSLAVR